MEELTLQVERLNSIVESLKNNTTIPKEIGDAFTARILGAVPKFGASALSPSTYTQGVNEAGAATYSVSKPMTGFVAFTINGVTYNVPYF